jgi:hypothetical protein
VSFFRPSRDQVRDFFFGVWARSRAGEALEGTEARALAVVLLHPEYHAVLSDPARYREREWPPEGGETNPFLHLSMHLAIDEQVSIDQPRGIRESVRRLAERRGSEHDALHDVLECLAEQVWQAQRNGTAFDDARYLDCLARKASPR